MDNITVLTLSQVFMVSSCLKTSVTTSVSPLKEHVTLTGFTSGNLKVKLLLKRVK